MDQLFPELYGEAKQTEPTTGWGEVLGPAFRLENAPTNFYNYLTQPTFPSSPDFDYERHWEEQKLPLEWKPVLAQSTSGMDFAVRLAKLRQEEMDKATLAAGGWKGTVAAMAAGMLDPTALIPIAGQASKGRFAVAEAFALAGVGATASEAALMLNQETRSGAESAASIGLNTVLGGLMGTGFLALEGRLKRKMTRDFPIQQEQVLVTRTGADGLEISEAVPTPTKRMADAEVLLDADEVFSPEFAVRVFGEAMPNLPTGELTAFHLRSADTQLALPEGRTSAAAWVESTFSPEIARAVEAEPGGAVAFLEKLAESYNTTGLRGLDDVYDEMLEKAGDGPAMRAEVEPYRSTVEQAISKAAPEGLSAQAAPQNYRNTGGLKRPKSRLAAALYDVGGKLNPLTRSANNRVSALTRDNALKLSTAGNRQQGLAFNQPSANGGLIEQRIKTHDHAQVKLFAALDDAYILHIYGKAEFDAGKRSALVAQLRSQILGVPPGKLTYAQFGEAVVDALATGKTEVPEAMQGAGAFRDFFAYYNNTHKEYLAERQLLDPEAAPMYRELTQEDFDAEGVLEYFHYIYDSAGIKQRSAEFLNQFSERAERQLLEAFAKAKEKHLARVRKMEEDLQFDSFTPEQKQARYDEVQADIDMYAEMPEYTRVREELADIRKQAREEGVASDSPLLKEQLKQVEEAAPKAYHEIVKLRQEAQKLSRHLRKLGGNALGEQDAARATAEALEESLYKSLSQMSDKVGVLKLQAVKDAKVMLGRISKAKEALGKAIDTLEARNAALAKKLASARKNPVSRAKAEELQAKAEARVKLMRDRLELVEGRAEGDQRAIDDLVWLRTDVLRETRDRLRTRMVKLEDAEAKLEEAEGKIYTPEELAKSQEELKQRLVDFEIAFDRKWSDNGAVWDDGTEATPNFKERALELATDLQQKLTGTGELRPAGIAILGAERGPQLQRMLKITYEEKKKWLIRDPETIARAFDRQMAPDLELWREFGSVNGGRMFTDLDADIRQIHLAASTATHVKLPADWGVKARLFAKRVQDGEAGPEDGLDYYLSEDNFSQSGGKGFEELTPKLREELTEFLSVQRGKLATDLGVMVQRLRRQRMVPQDASSIMWRTGRSIKDLNVVNMMGKVVPHSLNDIVRPILRVGLPKLYGKSWKPMLQNFKGAVSGEGYRTRSMEVNRRIGICLDRQLHSRASAVFDLAYDKASGLTLPERGLRFTANKMGVVALIDLWTDHMKNLSAAVVHATLAEYTPRIGQLIAEARLAGKDVVAGPELESQLVYLRRLGLRDDDILRIAQQMAQPNAMEKFGSDAVLPNLDVWEDKAAYRAYSAALTREVDDLIITPGLDRPNYHDENMAYSLLAQFQSYTFSSTNRVLMSGLQGNEPYLMQGIAFSLAFGALSYYAGAWVSGGKTWEDAKNRDAAGVLYSAVDKSGLLGVLSIPLKIGEQLPYTSEMAIFGGKEQKYRRPSGLYGTVFGPTAGQLEKVADIILNVGDEKQRERIMKRVWSLLPYNNVFYIQAALSRMRD